MNYPLNKASEPRAPGKWSLAMSRRVAFDGVDRRSAYWTQTMVAGSALSLSAGLLPVVWAGEAALDR